MSGDGVSYFNEATGEWQPAVPLPYYEKRWFRRERFVCYGAVGQPCRASFPTESDYSDHYIALHILGVPGAAARGVGERDADRERP